MVRRLISILAVIVALLLPGQASAHAHLMRAVPAPDSQVQVAPRTAHFWFDEPLNPALSSVVIRDAQGHQVNSASARLDAADGQELDLSLPTLTPGQYSVYWTSDSAQDAHVMHGFYVFTVGGPAARQNAGPAVGSVAATKPVLDATALIVALAHWLVLITATLWTGALALKVLVLLPAARAHGAADGSAALATEACQRATRLARLGLLGTLAASLLEFAAQAYAPAGLGAVASGSIWSALLTSQYGYCWIARVALACLALGVLRGSVGHNRGGRREGRCRPLRSLALMVTPRRVRQLWRALPKPPGPHGWDPMGAASIAMAYLLALALSGHAATVPVLQLTSVLLDWLHLLATAVWIGGIATIAMALLPAARSRIVRREDPRAELDVLLDLLDRFSPAAYLAVATAGVTGMFNAQVHLGSLGELFGSLYGRLLVGKLAAIGVLLLLSASHVVFTRPRLRRLSREGAHAGALAGVATLSRRLQLEVALGAVVLICVALMGQSVLAATVLAQPAMTPMAATPPAGATPATAQPISATHSLGALVVGPTIDPPAVGQAHFAVTVREGGKPVTNGQVRIKLSVPGSAPVGATFVETTAKAAGYLGSGDLVQTGHWRAEVLVRTPSDPREYRDLPFDFTVGPTTAFLGSTGASAMRGTRSMPHM